MKGKYLVIIRTGPQSGTSSSLGSRLYHTVATVQPLATTWDSADRELCIITSPNPQLCSWRKSLINIIGSTPQLLGSSITKQVYLSLSAKPWERGCSLLAKGDRLLGPQGD